MGKWDWMMTDWDTSVIEVSRAFFSCYFKENTNTKINLVSRMDGKQFKTELDWNKVDWKQTRKLLKHTQSNHGRNRKTLVEECVYFLDSVGTIKTDSIDESELIRMKNSDGNDDWERREKSSERRSENVSEREGEREGEKMLWEEVWVVERIEKSCCTEHSTDYHHKYNEYWERNVLIWYSVTIKPLKRERERKVDSILPR